MKIVTGGRSYIDIDVYGGIVAYAELVRAQGQQAEAVATPPLNASVPTVVQEWQPRLSRNYEAQAGDEFVVIDVSNPEHFETFVKVERVVAVLDHHVGFEEFWQKRLGAAAQIEFIGAACTLVYEAWQKAGLLDKLSQTSAKLLACGILDNTVNFGAEVTTDRDRRAYDDLRQRGGLAEDWPKRYFEACEAGIRHDAVAAVRNDSKLIVYATSAVPIFAGQIAVWDGPAVLGDWHERWTAEFGPAYKDWFINVISIGERRSYFLAESEAVRRWLTKLLGVTFDGAVGAADRVWLRKEILKKDQSLE